MLSAQHRAANRVTGVADWKPQKNHAPTHYHNPTNSKHASKQNALVRLQCFATRTQLALVVGWLSELYVLTTSKVISRRVPTCDSSHSW